MSRPKTTGRFATRAELVRRVQNFATINKLSDEAIARNCKVSSATVASIIKNREPLEYPEDFAGCDLITGESFDVDVNLDPRTHATCGSGYDFALYPLHVSDRVKHELDLL